MSGGPADVGGLRENDLITHINHEEIRGYSHNQVAALLAHHKRVSLTIVPLNESTIQQDMKKRSSIDAVRISKKSKTLKDLFPTRKKRGSNFFNKIHFPLTHRTSSASSTSSEKGQFNIVNIVGEICLYYILYSLFNRKSQQSAIVHLFHFKR